MVLHALFVLTTLKFFTTVRCRQTIPALCSARHRSRVAKMYKKLRSALTAGVPGRYVELTVASMISDYTQGFFVESFEYLDKFLLMTYDIVVGGMTGSKSAHQSPLYSTLAGTDSVNSAVQALKKLNFPANKIQIGVPGYGRGWKYSDWDNEEPLISHVTIAGAAATFDEFGGEPGVTSASSYPKMIAGIGEPQYDEVAMAAWVADRENQIIWSYDDAKAVTAKATYACTEGLAGLATWDIKEWRAGVTGQEGEAFAALIDAANKCQYRPVPPTAEVTLTQVLESADKQCVDYTFLPNENPTQMKPGSEVTIQLTHSNCRILEVTINDVIAVADATTSGEWTKKIVVDSDTTVHYLTL